MSFLAAGPGEPTYGRGIGRRLPPESAHYREMAHALRELARRCRFPGARRELLQLAARYERRADYFEDRAQRKNRDPGESTS
jgi:hypothetical protein